jgi:drug/metabolite transporter (DMT)-like permease
MTAPARRPLDATGFWLLLLLALVFASNNLLVKVGTDGFQPVMMAALRSGVALAGLAAWMVWRGLPFRPDLWRPGLMIGACFAIEFFLLFIALDLTTVVRAAMLFYAMPLWTALFGHFLFPGERLTQARLAGFLLGFAGVTITLAAQAGGFVAVTGGNLWGDLAALTGGLFWALIVVVARQTRLSGVMPETVLFWQLLVSTPLLAALAPIYGGPMLRAVDGWQWANLLVQGLGVAGAGFLLWFWLLRRYPSGSVASFGFVTPVLSVALGWAVLGEAVSPLTPVALLLLTAGLVLINRK